MAPIISVEQVWKRFKVPHQRHATILHHLANTLSFFVGARYSYEQLWALKDISLNLEQGESLGVIGPNGSGKSTLLKLMANIMKPEKGQIRVEGSVAPILELGIGFHRDLTVKENALIYGVIMGLRRSEMKKRTEDILEFAGLTKFEDAALKKLSSGMQVRLAFSIAVQTDADILLVDEALAVGDVEFKEKCYSKFREFKKEGRTVVLVSHDMDLIKEFCDRSLYLANGLTKFCGLSDEATNMYVKDMGAPSHPF